MFGVLFAHLYFYLSAQKHLREKRVPGKREKQLSRGSRVTADILCVVKLNVSPPLTHPTHPAAHHTPLATWVALWLEQQRENLEARRLPGSIPV